MSNFLRETYGMPVLEDVPQADEQLQSQVHDLLAGLYPSVPFERRREQRFPLPKLIRLLPVAANGVTSLGVPIIVSGKHISESGLSFFHPEPLAHRFVIAVLELGDRTQVEFLLDVDWCRCTQLGWYESGGRFIRTAS